MTVAQVKAARRRLQQDKRYRGLIKRTPLDKIKPQAKQKKK